MHKQHHLECDDCECATRDLCVCEELEVDAPHTNELISARISELNSENPHERARAAQFLFEMAHTSNVRASDNKLQMGREGAIELLCDLVATECNDAKFQACSALSELAFCNEKNCQEIVQSAKFLETLVLLLQPGHGATQVDAALIINNCAAFCSDTSSNIVQCRGMLEALQLLALDSECGAMNVAVGALNSLSRSVAVRESMIDAGVVGTLTSVLMEGGLEEADEARCARAAMAISNLTGSLAPVIDDSVMLRETYGSLCKIFKHALDERSWAGISFSPYSIVYPLYNLTLLEENRAPLVQVGIVELLCKLLRTWKQGGQQAEKTLTLGLLIVQVLANDGHYASRIKAAGVIDALIEVEEGVRKQPATCRDMAHHMLDLFRQRHVAMWMSQSCKLGAQSPLYALDENVAEFIFSLVEIE